MRIASLGPAALITLMAVTSAGAADLGGNCCADLEERVAELEATTPRKGNRKVSLEISGHINEAILFSDDFNDRDIINNTNSSGRFRFKGKAKISTEWSAGYLMEIGVNHNVPADHGIAAAINAQSLDPLNLGHQLTIRHQALYIKSKSLGTVWLGQTSSATDGITEIEVAQIVGSTLMSATALGVNAGLDGGRPSGLIRYISPDIGGFALSAAWIDNDTYDAAIRYAGEFGSIRLAAGIGYQKRSEDDEVISGSLSVMETKSGLFISAAAGRNRAGDDGTISVSLGDFGPAFVTRVPVDQAQQYAVRVGIQKKVLKAGKTTIYGGYSKIDVEGVANTAGVNFSPTYWELGIEQKIDAAAMDIYAVYRDGDTDQSGAGLGDDESFQHVIVGAKIKF